MAFDRNMSLRTSTFPIKSFAGLAELNEETTRVEFHIGFQEQASKQHVETIEALMELPRLTHLKIHDAAPSPEAMVALSKLPALQELELTSPGHAIDELSKIPTLRRLRLSGSGYQRFAEGPIRAIASLTQVEELSLHLWTPSKDGDLECLLEMPQLRALKLDLTSQDPAELFGYFANLCELRDLEVSLKAPRSDGKYVQLHPSQLVSDECLLGLESSTKLTRLKLDNNLSHEGIEFLTRWSELEYLGICLYPDDKLMGTLAAFTKLRRLNLGFLDELLSPKGVEKLMQLPFLEELDLRGPPSFSDDLLQPLTGHPTLISLSLSENPMLSDRTLQVVGTIEKLEYLDLSYCEGFTGDGISQLKPLKKLRAMSLCGCGDLGNDSLLHIGKIPSLQELSIAFCGITEIGPITNLRDLRYLNAGFLPLKDELSALTGLSELSTLSLDSCQVSDKGLEHLSGLRSLQALSASSNTVTGEGLLMLCDRSPALSDINLQTGCSGQDLLEARGIRICWRSWDMP